MKKSIEKHPVVNHAKVIRVTALNAVKSFIPISIEMCKDRCCDNCNCVAITKIIEYIDELIEMP